MRERASAEAWKLQDAHGLLCACARSFMWTTIKKILPFNVNKLGLGEILEFNEICNNWDKILDNFFGVRFKNKSKPVSLKNKVLIVDCLNSIWASELQLKQPKIIEAVNKKFGKDIIEKIKFIN